MKNPFPQFEGQELKKDPRPVLRMYLKNQPIIRYTERPPYNPNSNTLPDGTQNPARINPAQMAINKNKSTKNYG